MLPRQGEWPTLGWQVIDWMETFLVHGPGDVQGQAYEVNDDFALFLLWAYRLFGPRSRYAGQRMVARAVRSRPKGFGKSEDAGALVCAEALGPVRFDGWDAKGEPVGKPLTYPFIRCLATEEGQAGNTYDNVVVMLTDGRAGDEYAVDVGLTRTFIKEPGGGEITPSTASSSAKEGGKESFAVSDETHLYVLPELKKMHATVRRNTGKRQIAQPWMLDTTTAYEPGDASIAEVAHLEYGEKPVEKVLKDHGVLYDHDEAPEIKDWNSDAEIRAALKRVYKPVSDHIDFRRLLGDIRAPESSPAEAKRYWLNQATATERVWVTPAQIRALRSTKTVERGERITLGFDGSRFIDSTVLMGCRLIDGHLFPLGWWERPDGPDGEGWEVPTGEVDVAVDDAFRNYGVVKFFGDPPHWTSEMDQWRATYGDIVEPFWTNRNTQMARAVGRARTLIRGRDITTNGDERLEEHLRNARARRVRVFVEQDDGVAHVIEKERKNSPRKIDGAVAAVLALEARGEAIAEGALEPPRSNVPVSIF